MSPKITKARGATSADDGSNLFEQAAPADNVEKQAIEVADGETGELTAELERPNKSATRAEWDAYAASLGIDPGELANKGAVIEACDSAES